MRFAAFLPLLPLALAAVAIPPPPQSNELAHTYMVKFSDDASKTFREEHLDWIRGEESRSENGAVELRHVFSLAFHGYSAVLDHAALDVVRNLPEVVAISHVGMSTPPMDFPGEQPLQSQTVERMIADPSSPKAPGALVTIQNRGWNANRISHREFKKGYTNGPWLRDQFLGANATVYVLDTGINLAQPGFRGSTVLPGKNFVRTGQRGATNNDVHGHGTMCAGVIAGNLHGLAPEAVTTSVKISNDLNHAACDDTVAGIEWVTKQPGPNNMKVISMSQYNFTGRPDVSVAVGAAVAKGVHVVVCAGNDGLDSCKIEPSNAPGVIAVGSVDGMNRIPLRATDREGSNIGKCITVFAPGSRVPTLSSKNLSPTYQYWGWGTSIAAPQVAAMIANRLSAMGPQTPAQIKRWLQGSATEGQVEGELKGARNLIAYTGPGAEILKEY